MTYPSPEELDAEAKNTRILEIKKELKDLGDNEAPNWFIVMGVVLIAMPVFAIVIRFSLWILGVHL